MNAEQIFHKAVEMSDSQERVAYLDQICQGNDALRFKVEALLRADDQARDFLEVSPGDCTVTLDKSLLSEGPGTVIGPYKLLEQIGEGGMAVVYMAQQERPLRRRVAIKIIKLGMDTKQVMARFDAERQVLAMMDHPHIAKVLDAGATDTGRPYFVMQLVHGVSITEYCDKNRLTTQERLELFVPVCNAVHHAHQKGIIHRDLKPSNIMVTMHDGKPVPMVIDFGIAKATNQRLTEQTIFTRYAEMIGTPEYMSPEQAEMSGLDIDTRTDIYSLGVVLYELLIGTLPFDATTLRAAAFGEIQRIIREEEPMRPSTRLSGLGKKAEAIAAQRQTNVAGLSKRLHRELEWIPMKAMRKDRTRRYRSVSEFTDDIKNYLIGTPLIAGPETAFYRLQKFVHRYRWPVAVTIGIAAAIIIGLAVSTSFYIRTKRAQAQMARLESQVEVDKRLSTAQQLYAEGRYQAALVEIETNLQEGKPDVKMQLFHAQLLFDLERLTESESILETLVQGDPETAAVAHYLLARINLERNPDKAKEHQKLAKSLLAHSANAYVLRAMTADTPDMMINWLTQALDMESDNHAARQARAWAYYGSNKFDKMLQDAEVIVATRPKDAFGFALRALAKQELGAMEEALKDYNRVIGMCRLDSELARYHSQRQETFFRMKDYSAALSDAQRSVSLIPTNLTYRILLGRALFATGQYEKAAQEFELVHKAPGFKEFQVDEIMLQFVSDLVREGKTISIPENLASVWPFDWIRSHEGWYQEMAKRGTLLVRGAYGRSSWSPNGKQLAYARSAEFWGSWNRSYSTAGPAVGATQRGIEIRDIETGDTHVAVTDGVDPAWSPDEKFIAFVRQPSFFQRHLSEIWLIRAQGGEARRISLGDWPTWSSDSKQLYYHSYSENALYSIDIEDPLAKPKYVLDCPGESPSISPDGKYVADAMAGVLIILERSSGREVIRWVVPGPGEFCGVQWAPDGNEISLTSLGRFASPSGLWVFNLREKQGWHVLDPMGAFCNWSRDRTHIAIDVTFPICEIWLVKTDPNQSTQEALGLNTSRADYIRENWDTYAQAAGEGEPWIRTAIMQNLMEMAANQYDFGQFKDAQWLLTKLDELHQTLVGRPHPRIVALTAKTLFQLGSQDEAQGELTRLRQIYTYGNQNDEHDLYDAESTLTGNHTLKSAWDQIANGEPTRAMTALVSIEDTLATDSQVRFIESVQSLRKALARAFVRRAKDIRHRNGPFPDIIESIEQALSSDPNSVAGLCDLAWLQAVCSDANYRNGTNALENARRACELTDWKSPDCLTTLAAGYAEAGKFDQAIKWQQEALGAASEDTCAGQRREMALRLECYQSGTQVCKERIKPCIARWNFDRTKGQMLTDVSGNGNNAQLMGAARLAPDHVGSALLLGREGGYVECPNESAFDLRDEIAISCWIRADALTEYDQPIITKGEYAWQLFKRGDTKQLAFHCAGVDSPSLWGVTGQMAVDDDRWHHVVAAFDGQRLYLYVDGDLDASVLVSGKIATNDEAVQIGAFAGEAQRDSWHGSIDEVCIYSGSLTVGEIRTLYEEGKRESRNVGR